MKTAGLTGGFTLVLCLAAAGVMAQDDGAAGAAADTVRIIRTTPAYSAGGQRDPFDSLAPALEEEGQPIKDLFDYEDGALKGIVRIDDGPYAMVVDGDGMSYVLFENSRVRGGYVSRISDDAVYLNIAKYGRTLTIIFRTQESQSREVQMNSRGETVVRKPGITIDFEKTGSADGGVTITDVLVPHSRIKTVEEEWFGVSRDAEPGATVEQTAQQGMFALYDPADMAEVVLPYEFNWTDPSVADVEYTMIIDDDPDFSSPAVTVAGITGSAYLMTGELGLPEGMRLYWRVIATDADGGRLTSFRSDMSFTIQSEQEVNQ